MNIPRGDHRIVPIWVVGMALLVCAPLLTSGYVLTYDMVWVPHLDLQRSEVWGLDSALPRAVPSDAFAAVLGALMPAMLVQKFLLVGALVGAGLGAHQLVRDRPLVGQFATVTLAVWNPYVAERLLLGQWPLLIAYAGIFWLLASLCREDGPRWSTVTLALAATALTPATGVIGAVAGLVAGWRRGSIRVLVIAAAMNAPWIIASLLQPNLGQSDPAAVGLFDVQAEGSFGRLGSALTLGGIWNTEVVPTSRTLPLAVAFALAMGLVMLVGLVVLFVSQRRLLVVMVTLGVLGLAVALSGWLFPDLVTRVVTDVPGGGLVRDGTRWLALLVPLEAVAFGAGVSALLEVMRTSWRLPAALVVAALPIAAMPDLAWGVGNELKTVHYPAVWDEARGAIAELEQPGDIVSLPFAGYRAPQWNHDRTVIDPAGRYFDRTTVTNDELLVAGVPIAGEDPRAAAVARILERPDPVNRLVRRGIGVVVIDTTAPGGRDAAELFRGEKRHRLSNDDLQVYVLPAAEVEPITPEDRRSMIGAWSIAGAALLLGLVGAARRGAGLLHRKSPKDRSRQMT